MNRSVITPLNTLTASLLFACATLSQAQESAGEAADNNPMVLEEVVVTATKREQSLRDIPTSIDAFSGQHLDGIGATALADIIKLSPGVTMEPGFTPGTSTVQIRGITNESRGVGPRTVGRFYDGVPLINPSIIGVQPDVDTVDMRAVEVLKGPQGTLFGGSALAGAVRYVPAQPEFDRFYGRASLGYGTMASSDDSSSEYSLMLNLPLGETFALRFAGAIRDYAGFIDDAVSGDEDINDYRSEHGRLLAKWQVTDQFSANFTYLKQTGEIGAYSFLEGTDNDRVRQYKYLPEFEDTEFEIYGARFDFATEDFTIVFDNNWLDKERSSQADLTYVVQLQGSGITVNQNFMPTTDQNTHELRIVSNRPTGGNALLRDWEYTVGLFYMQSDQTRPSIVDINLPGAVSRSIGGEFAEAREKAIYFDLTRTFAERWELNLGGRYFDQKTEGGNFLSGGGDLGIPDGSTQATLKESDFNPKAALMFHANENVTVFASAASGFRFGGINGAAVASGDFGVPTSYKSDSLDNYELGIRTNWMNNRVTADLTAFRIDWTDMQIQQRAGVVAYVDNIGKAKVTGYEFALNALLGEGFSTRIAGSYTKARTREDFESASSGFIPSGSRLPQAPRWTGSANLSYDTSWENWDFRGSATYSYRGSSHNNLQNSIPLDSYNMLDLAFSVGALNLPMNPRLNLIVKNLTDENVATFGWSLGTAVDLVSLLTPRQVLLRLDLEF
ncbi:TonB-dependent receptor [Elongatibacter sediminis]|uniref:TonB-dependent receptor n=1 Tax=Elongatibacter sediminis TaxID=3119006 RepID=A0AAW9R961_9GAMM